MALFEGGKFNRDALGPLQNLFSPKNTGTASNQQANQGFQVPWQGFQDLATNFKNYFASKNGKSRQPLINTEDQTMRLPNFLFPKQNPKSILNLPGKVFNKENMEKLKGAYGDVFGEGGLLSKADFGNFANPWAARDAKSAVEPSGDVTNQGGLVDSSKGSPFTKRGPIYDEAPPIKPETEISDADDSWEDWMVGGQGDDVVIDDNFSGLNILPHDDETYSAIKHEGDLPIEMDKVLSDITSDVTGAATDMFGAEGVDKIGGVLEKAMEGYDALKYGYNEKLSGLQGMIRTNPMMSRMFDSLKAQGLSDEEVYAQLMPKYLENM